MITYELLVNRICDNMIILLWNSVVQISILILICFNSVSDANLTSMVQVTNLGLRE